VKPVIENEFADGADFLNFRNLLLQPSSLGGDAATIGAAALPFDPLFRTGEFSAVLAPEPALTP
jgi:hypothetical protein